MKNEEKVKQFTMIVVPTEHEDWMAFYRQLPTSNDASLLQVADATSNGLVDCNPKGIK